MRKTQWKWLSALLALVMVLGLFTAIPLVGAEPLAGAPEKNASLDDGLTWESGTVTSPITVEAGDKITYEITVPEPAPVSTPAGIAKLHFGNYKGVWQDQLIQWDGSWMDQPSGSMPMIYKGNVKTVTFVDLPNQYTGSSAPMAFLAANPTWEGKPVIKVWDGTFPKKIGLDSIANPDYDDYKVLVWVTETEAFTGSAQDTNDTLKRYDLFIGGYGGVWLNYYVIDGSTSYFQEFANLESIDFSGLHTSMANNLRSMFNGCISLTTIDLSNFDPSTTALVGNMFGNCISLAFIDMSSLDLSDLHSSSSIDIFYNLYPNCEIWVRNAAMKEWVENQNVPTTVTVKVVGPPAGSTQKVTDTIPVGLTIDETSITGTESTTPIAGQITWTLSGQTITWSVPADLLPEELQAAVTVNSGQTSDTLFENTAYVGATPTNTTYHEYINSTPIAKYTITYQTDDGYLDYNDPTLRYDGEVVTIDGTHAFREGYSLMGWFYNSSYYPGGSTFIMPAENVLFIGSWIPFNYDIIYLLDGGTNDPSNPATYTIVDSFTLKDPVKDGYTFSGWQDSSGNPITGIQPGSSGDLYLYALWSPIEYTVNFVDFDGATLKSETVAYGNSATAPTAPERTGFIFDGWDKDFSSITADLTVTALYKPAPQASPWLVEFLDWDGTVLKEEYVDDGEKATAPAVPERTGYTFTGWDRDFDSITGNLAVTALYDAIWYTVTFVDYDGTVLKTETVTYGNGATAPSVPDRTGFTFTGWDNDFNNIAGDLLVTALYEINAYTVEVNGSYAGIGNTGAGEYPPGATVTINAGNRSGYSFNGWTVTSASGTVTLLNPNSASTTFTMPDEAVTLTANWQRNGGGSGGSTPTTPTVTTTEGDDDSDSDSDSDSDGDNDGDNDGDDDNDGDVADITDPDTPEESAEEAITGRTGEQNQQITGGTDRAMPQGNPPGTSLVAEGAGFLELDENNVPLGMWTWDEDQGIWIFDEYAPLANLPKTGDRGTSALTYLLLGLLLVCAGVAYKRRTV